MRKWGNEVRNWLGRKKNLQRLRREERIALVDFKEREIPLTFQAKRLGLNRSSLYYEPIGPSEDEIRIKHRIERHYQYPFFGSRRMTAMLRRENRIINRKPKKGLQDT
ncbi:MAG: hypothetical protein IMW85_09715 [Thermicanus sp.]|nr:hypothetical protein [Thermicanus sp.]